MYRLYPWTIYHPLDHIPSLGPYTIPWTIYHPLDHIPSLGPYTIPWTIYHPLDHIPSLIFSFWYFAIPFQFLNRQSLKICFNFSDVFKILRNLSSENFRFKTKMELFNLKTNCLRLENDDIFFCRHFWNARRSKPYFVFNSIILANVLRKLQIFTTLFDLQVVCICLVPPVSHQTSL